MRIYVPEGAYMRVGEYVYSFSYRCLFVQPQTFVRSATDIYPCRKAVLSVLKGGCIRAGKNFSVQGRSRRYAVARGERGEGCYDK